MKLLTIFSIFCGVVTVSLSYFTQPLYQLVTKKPTLPKHISIEFINTILRQHKAITCSKVTSMTVQPCSGKGFVNQVARIQLEYDKQEKCAVKSLILKTMRATFTAKLKCCLVKLYKEPLFYKHFVDTKFPLQVPKVYYASDSSRCSLLLVMEDVEGENVSTWNTEDDVDKRKVETAVTQLARFHAAFTNKFPEHEWLNLEQFHDLMFTGMKSNVSAAFAMFPCYVTKSVLKNQQKLRSLAIRAAEYIRKTCSHTFVHYDYRIGNMIWKNPGDCTVIDWQTIGIGNGMVDLAFFMVMDLPPRTRRQNECRLIELYRCSLAEHGHPIDFELLWCQYILTLVAWQLPAAINGAAFIDGMIEDQSEAPVKILFERSMIAIEEHDALTKVEEFLNDKQPILPPQGYKCCF